MNKIDYILDKINKEYSFIVEYKNFVHNKLATKIEIYENEPGYDMITKKYASLIEFKLFKESHKYIKYIRFIEADRVFYYTNRKKCLNCGLDEMINYNKYLGCNEYIMDCALE